MNRKRSGPAGMPSSFKAGGWKHSGAVRIILLLLFVLLFYVSLAPRLVPETYDIALNSKSEHEIKAPHQIVDEKATLEAQEKAAEKVDSVYSNVGLHNELLIDEILIRIDQLNQDDQVTTQDKVDIYRREIPERLDQYISSFIQSNSNSTAYSANLLAEMKSVVEEQQYSIPEETFYKMPKLTSEQISEMRTVSREIVRKVSGESIADAETARITVPELVNASSLSQRAEREIVQELARFVITPNKFYDKDATEEAKVQAKQNTPAVVIKQGDPIVKAGEVITQDIYDRLDSLGLLKEEKNYLPQLGVFLLSLLFVSALVGYREFMAALASSSSPTTGKRSNVQWLMLLLIFALNLLLMHLVALAHSERWPYIAFLAPVALGSMLVTLLLDMHLGIVSAILFSCLSSIILNVGQETVFDFQYGFVTAVVSFASVLAIHRASQRSSILKAGVMASLFGSIAVVALQLVQSDVEQGQMLQTVGFMLVSGLFTAVLVIGLMPFFELTFGILSALKLVELSNPNHPLLRKLLTETPGTYHHSLMVGNLSEAAAEAVGANGLLCRVGSFYHDVGKTKRPSYFIENQNGGANPHDKLDPKVSASIIIAHARDGAEMLRQHKIPKPIRDIAEQHHGTTFLKFFYYKAVKQAEAQGVENQWTEDDFRYPGPKAQSKEAAIVGIADSVEAAVRSLDHPTVDQVEAIIAKIIKDRLDDQQFNECDLTIREMDKIAETLKETVIGMFHSRIEYPDDKSLKSRGDAKEQQE
ncbi:HD family phosphohydrolase [Cohnella thailandensis]|uniref:HDIG domain-containing protein n=1 Tax=Cohnella thailandensis TaxID=557557 RepID=A0A841T2D6_9BACL|nr:HDIG domain-containing metalloprotein [Cohnella thailandensis]MBB6636230.1 HDIG domain-containing protein [Cohnella thailandensis]MBP1973801.1 putative nucleotidyltransferase with HDIG domain [Cohnella thailandensis]